METRLIKSSICIVNNIFRPAPQLFTFPGLTSLPIWDKTLIPAVSILEDNFSSIKAEYLKNRTNLNNDYKIGNDHALHKGEWEWSNYIAKGQKITSFKKTFPITSEILDNISDKMENIPFSYCFFSKLHAKSSIAPHYGPTNIRLRVHLGIDVPDDCSIEIAGKNVRWAEGKCLVFDDTYLHSVENRSDKQRVILLLDLWHPDLYPEEKEALVNMFGKAVSQGWIKN